MKIHAILLEKSWLDFENENGEARHLWFAKEASGVYQIGCWDENKERIFGIRVTDGTMGRITSGWVAMSPIREPARHVDPPALLNPTERVLIEATWEGEARMSPTVKDE